MFGHQSSQDLLSDEEVEEGDEDGDDQQQLLNGGHAGLSKEEQDRLRAEEEEEERKRFGRDRMWEEKCILAGACNSTCSWPSALPTISTPNSPQTWPDDSLKQVSFWQPEVYNSPHRSANRNLVESRSVSMPSSKAKSQLDICK